MIGYPIDSHVTFESDGTPVYDRAVSSAPLRQLISKLFSDGILPNPSTNMQVVAGTGMNVIVYPGFAICSGCLKMEESQRTLAVQASNANYDRIDTVVLRLNDNDSERICDFYILEGTPATSPVRPTLTRTESIWEIGLADLFIAKNSTALSNQRITDTRYEAARCGVMSSISQFDTTTLYQQVQADLEEFQSVSQAEFIEWYESIKGQLSEDAAGNLQNQIGDLSQLETQIKTSLVNAINSLLKKENSYIGMIIYSATLDTEEKVKSFYGGKSWSKIEEKFLLGASETYEIGSTGGEATHRLTVNEMPSHTHNVNIWLNGSESGTMQYAPTTGKMTTQFQSTPAGGNQAHNNMPPYRAVYIWERVE